ncbi:hypothetical protein LLH00_02785, partial [bacterium]|nr:hypothetical protein [bacterium]
AAPNTAAPAQAAAQDNAATTAEDTAAVHTAYPHADPEKQARESYLSRVTEEGLEKSVKDIKHLPPSDFALLPSEIQVWLAAEGYSIPQPYDSTERVNVISGDFCAAGSQDWAVLASKDEMCCIIVFRHGSASDTLLAAVSPERDYMGYTGNGRFGFIRQIETADPFYGEKYTPVNIDSIFPSTDHYGIGGKDHGGLLYCDNGIWYSFEGYYDEMYLSPGVWLAATEAVKRLPPSAFPDLPAPAREWLEKEGYTIPQSNYTRNPHNVIYGSFYVADTLDWAVLASRDLESRVIVFRRGVEPDTSTKTLTQDLDYMQGNGPYIEFQRYIEAVDRSYIASGFKLEQEALPLDHEGIEISKLDRWSYVLYQYNGQWYKISESDEDD